MIKSEKTIVFDLSEVIIRGIVGIEIELEPILRIGKDDILSCFGGENLRHLCIGKLSEKDYFQKIIDENKWNISINKLKKIVRNNFNREIPGMPSFIYKLSKSNSLLLYSDHAREWISYIQKKHSFLQIFKKLIFSFDLNFLKTDCSAFTHLLQCLQMKCSDIIFIDDNIKNIRNAGSVGIEAILFKNKFELEKILMEKQ